MCGIAGMSGPAANRDVLQAMVASLSHRGPDDTGLVGSSDTVLGHRRLSIIDLKTGDQPMERDHLALVHNGEIYNFEELRQELEAKGHRFHTVSDSEVILAGYQEWGVGVFPKLDGMFALAIWDRPRRRLVLARDLLGIKPLHYRFDGSTLEFGSEVKALLQNPAVGRDVDFGSLHLFLNLRYVPGEKTLFRGIKRLQPGHVLIFENGSLSIRRYASVEAADHGGLAKQDFAPALEDLLRNAVRKQLRSDVPVGVYLSGGLDSSSLVALASEQAGAPVQTFSLGFGLPSDETSDARSVAERFSTDHHEMVLDHEPIRSYPSVVWAAEEPKENILQGYLLAQFAREKVKVVLGGLGGDELFAGYGIHRFLAPLDRLHMLVPSSAQRFLLSPLSRLAFWAQRSSGLLRFDQYRRGLQLLLSAGDPTRSYLIVRNAWDSDPLGESLYGDAWHDQEVVSTRAVFGSYFEGGGSSYRQALKAELDTKLVDDLLLNEDRTSMAHGLEVRVPFLDRALVEFALGLPLNHLKPQRLSKPLLRQAMRTRLSNRTLQKPKTGFSFDAYEQFKTDLGLVARRILTKRRVEQRGWFSYPYLKRIMEQRPHPRMRWHYFFLWLAVGLEIWARMFIEGDVSEPVLELESYFE